MKNKTRFLLLTYPIALLALCVALLLASCMTPERAARFLKKKGKLAEVCAVEFPVRDSAVGREEVSYDTTVQVIDQPAQEGYIDILPEGDSCKPKKIATYITKTVRRDSIIYRRDVAREAVLQGEINTLEATIHDQQAKLQDRDATIIEKNGNIKSLQKRNRLYLLALLGFVVYLFRKQIGGLILRLSNPISRIYPF